MDEIRCSVWPSGFLPKTIQGTQLSVLLRDASFHDHREEYFAGFEAAYRRCMERKEELTEDVQALFADIPVRMMIRSTQPYSDLMRGLYSQSVLASRQAYDSFAEKLRHSLQYRFEKEDQKRIGLSETLAILRQQRSRRILAQSRQQRGCRQSFKQYVSAQGKNGGLPDHAPRISEC